LKDAVHERAGQANEGQEPESLVPDTEETTLPDGEHIYIDK